MKTIRRLWAHTPADVWLLVVGQVSRHLLNIAPFHFASLLLLPLSGTTDCDYGKWGGYGGTADGIVTCGVPIGSPCLPYPSLDKTSFPRESPDKSWLQMYSFQASTPTALRILETRDFGTSSESLLDVSIRSVPAEHRVRRQLVRLVSSPVKFGLRRPREEER